MTDLEAIALRDRCYWTNQANVTGGERERVCHGVGAARNLPETGQAMAEVPRGDRATETEGGARSVVRFSLSLKRYFDLGNASWCCSVDSGDNSLDVRLNFVPFRYAKDNDRRQCI